METNALLEYSAVAVGAVIVDSQQWPQITLLQVTIVAFHTTVAVVIRFEQEWYKFTVSLCCGYQQSNLWCHHLWCGVKNAFGISVYFQVLLAVVRIYGQV
jgi:hypothetical protein